MAVQRKQRGFTLLELLVAIAIIGLLAAIVLASLGPSRERARNAQVLSQMYEYQKALDLYYLSEGRYPNSWTATNRGQIHCVGTGYVDGTDCLPFSVDDDRATEVEQVLVPTYISQIRHIQQGIDNNGDPISSPAYRGCSRLETGPFAQLNGNLTSPGPPPSDCTDQNYSLFFALEGVDQDCGRAHTVSIDYGARGYTICQISSAQ